MARKDIYFLSTGSEGQRGLLGDLAISLQCSLRAKCVIFCSAKELIQRLARRKTRLNMLVLLLDKVEENLFGEICKKISKEAYPRKVIFVQSSFSSIAGSLLEQSSEKLRKVEIEPIAVSLTEICSMNSVRQLLEI